MIAIGPTASREPMEKTRLVTHAFQQQRRIGAACEFLRKLDVEELAHRGLEEERTDIVSCIGEPIR